MLKKITPILLLIFSVVLFPNNAAANSSVWKVTKDGNSLYLAGTLHLLKNSDYPLPAEFDNAFKASDTIFFETDIAQVQSPQFQQVMMQAMFNNGTKLKSQLTTDTWNRLEVELATKGIPLKQLNDFKVSLVLLTLTIAEYQMMGFTAPGVDATFYEKSKDAQKNIDFLETPEQQINFLADMGADNPERMVKYTLNDLNKMPEYVAKLKNAWRSGDLKALQEFGLKEMQTEYPKVFESLIKTRNENWLTKIDKLIKTSQTEALYVGALHLAGDVGLVARLKEKGYKVTQL